MCGIVGYAGSRQAASVLLDGLEKLEYRGYDSAGVCVHNDGALNTVKAKGRLSVLRDRLEGGDALPGCVGIGHTRWATHGAPSDTNSHPHLSWTGKIAVVHNGIIENEARLREKCLRKGATFQSETDTEVVSTWLATTTKSTATSSMPSGKPSCAWRAALPWAFCASTAPTP